MKTTSIEKLERLLGIRSKLPQMYGLILENHPEGPSFVWLETPCEDDPSHKYYSLMGTKKVAVDVKENLSAAYPHVKYSLCTIDVKKIAD